MSASSADCSTGRAVRCAVGAGRQAKHQSEPVDQTLIRSCLRDATIQALRILDDPMDAEDAAQTALLTMWSEWAKSRDVHRHANRRLSWIVYSCCLDLQETNALAQTPGMFEPPAVAEDCLSSIQRNESAVAVRQAISRLTQKQREVIIAHYYDEKTIEETARSIGISMHAVNNLLMRARYRLKKALLISVKDIRRFQEDRLRAAASLSAVAVRRC